ncbi:MAG TPA: hypothetical protein VF698_10485 [Thermoanaerobaculia bacterium]
MSWSVTVADALTAELVLAAFRKETAAVVIPRYCDEETAGRLADALLQSDGRTNYLVRWSTRSGREDALALTDVDRVGPVDSTDSPQTTVDAIRRMRSATAPALSPIDRLRLELDEVLPLGASLEREKDGEPYNAGVGRIMERSDAIVHADVARQGCLTANVYLRMPAKGGSTRIWRHEGTFLGAGSSYIFDRDEIGDDVPYSDVIPAVGDLILWNPCAPHVVLPFTGGPRVTLQTWLRVVASEVGQIGVRILN